LRAEIQSRGKTQKFGFWCFLKGRGPKKCKIALFHEEGATSGANIKVENSILICARRRSSDQKANICLLLLPKGCRAEKLNFLSFSGSDDQRRKTKAEFSALIFSLKGRRPEKVENSTFSLPE
jgi:hypothetical protein